MASKKTIKSLAELATLTTDIRIEPAQVAAPVVMATNHATTDQLIDAVVLNGNSRATVIKLAKELGDKETTRDAVICARLMLSRGHNKAAAKAVMALEDKARPDLDKKAMGAARLYWLTIRRECEFVVHTNQGGARTVTPKKDAPAQAKSAPITIEAISIPAGMDTAGLEQHFALLAHHVRRLINAKSKELDKLGALGSFYREAASTFATSIDRIAPKA